MTYVRDTVFVRYAAPDLDRMESFLTDFGLHRVLRTDRALYMRAAGDAPFAHVTELAAEPATLGFGLLARQADDLEAIARRFDAKVEDNPEPGGGRRVRLTDPSGFIVDVVHGQTRAAPLRVRAPIDANPAVGRRRIDHTVRGERRPSNVIRFGHVALLVTDFRAACEFYRELGLRPSDSYYAGVRENVIATFMHCGLGEEFTDHHTLALITSPEGRSRFDHAAFEVLDLDDLMQGHAHLQSRGRTHAWGVGRHIEGSQIFDYWRDPFGHKLEHWTDGDLVNDHTPAGLAPMGEGALSQWGPPLTPEFFR